jgi:hypothetical protein
MTTITQLRDPAELASDIATLSSVDWPVVWRGYEALPESELRDWCAQFGWRLEEVNRVLDLTVGLPTGGTLHLYQRRPPHGGSRIDELRQVSWQVEAASVEENDTILDLAAAAWPEYLNAARDVLGTPVWSGSWEDPHFPESERWLPQELRMIDRDPYRLAVWAATAIGGPIIELWVNVSHGTASRLGPGGAAIQLTVLPSEQDPDGDGGIP